jgi:hypothetical protein
VQRLILPLCLCLAGGSAVFGAQEPSQGPPAAQATESKRADLWKAFGKALPDGVTWQAIDVYAENASLSQICFRSRGVTYVFDLASGKTQPVLHAKALPDRSVNAITFLEGKAGGAFILWSNGTQQLSISARE